VAAAHRRRWRNGDPCGYTISRRATARNEKVPVHVAKGLPQQSAHRIMDNRSCDTEWTGPPAAEPSSKRPAGWKRRILLTTSLAMLARRAGDSGGEPGDRRDALPIRNPRPPTGSSGENGPNGGPMFAGCGIVAGYRMAGYREPRRECDPATAAFLANFPIPSTRDIAELPGGAPGPGGDRAGN
jgi:hypothetical protein